jgi:hypothetical protein
MRDVTPQRPFVIFTPQDIRHVSEVEADLARQEIPVRALFALSEDGASARKVFLADIDFLPFVKEDNRIQCYITADAFRVCAYFDKQTDASEVIGTLENASRLPEGKDTEYRFFSGASNYVIR